MSRSLSPGPPPRFRGERGAAAVEFALVVPLLVLLFGLVVGGARLWLARATIDHAAAAAARAGSLARAPTEAVASAKAVAELQISAEALRCRDLEVRVDADGLAAPPGTAAVVEVTVTCTVSLADVLVPGWPGELAVTATATSVVDSYRGRS